MFSCSLTELEQATRNWSKSHCIGEGGFGEVYRGYLNTKNGRQVRQGPFRMAPRKCGNFGRGMITLRWSGLPCRHQSAPCILIPMVEVSALHSEGEGKMPSLFLNRLAKVCHEVEKFCRNLQILSTSSLPVSLNDRKYISCRYLSLSISTVNISFGVCLSCSGCQLSVLLISNFWISGFDLVN